MLQAFSIARIRTKDATLPRSGYRREAQMADIRPLWPTLFAVAGVLLVIREFIGIRKTPDFSATTRLFLLLASCLFIVAGFADIAVRLATIGKW